MNKEEPKVQRTSSVLSEPKDRPDYRGKVSAKLLVRCTTCDDEEGTLEWIPAKDVVMHAGKWMEVTAINTESTTMDLSAFEGYIKRPETDYRWLLPDFAETGEVVYIRFKNIKEDEIEGRIIFTSDDCKHRSLLGPNMLLRKA